MAVAAAVRKPFAHRLVTQPQLPVPLSPINTRRTVSGSLLKRPRSPGVNDVHPSNELSKRHKHEVKEKEKEKRKQDRGVREEEFKVKYTKAFPQWTFYFDTTDAERESLGLRVMQLGAGIAKFFSNEVTHFITNKPIPEEGSDKENASKSKRPTKPLLRSPIRLRGMPEDVSTSGYEALIKKARSLGIKIWETSKLDSVLDRCGAHIYAPSNSSRNPTRSLNELLESERRFGTTSERDPTQRRHDYRYFSKNSYFVLVEDMSGEVATIVAHEYPIECTADGKEIGSWPIAHCHPLSRNPFIEYNEREERRKRRQEQREEEEAKQMDTLKRKMKLVQREQKRQLDLRRSVSMNNIRTGQPEQGEEWTTHHGGETPSGYLESTGTGGYVAASGNSVGVTSTFGTTSTMGLGSMSQASILPKLRSRLNEVITSRRVSSIADEQSGSRNGSAGIAGPSRAMPPPAEIPHRARPILKKSKSTNTMRLPKRNEDSKPGYCESCRSKFEDFKHHIRGTKHRKFAENDANFLQLDLILNRVRRQTIEEVEAEKESDLHNYSEDYQVFSSRMASERFENEDQMDSDC